MSLLDHSQDDEARLRELCARLHLWQSEVDEVLEIGARIGVVVVIRKESLGTWEPTESNGRDEV